MVEQSRTGPSMDASLAEIAIRSTHFGEFAWVEFRGIRRQLVAETEHGRDPSMSRDDDLLAPLRDEVAAGSLIEEAHARSGRCG